MPLPEGVTGSAEFSPCGRYRYRLSRSWGKGDEPVRRVCFCGLNPSDAGATDDDPTIRRLVGFARRWGFNELVMVNLYPWIETDSLQLFRATDPAGHGNDRVVETEARSAERFLACWGATAPEVTQERVLYPIRRAGTAIWAFALTKGRQPVHPLYLPYSIEPFIWRAGRGS